MTAQPDPGFEYEKALAAHLVALPVVSSLTWFARSDPRAERRIDFVVALTGGARVAIDATCDPRDHGSVWVRQAQFDRCEEWARREGCAAALVCAGSPAVGTHHAFTSDITKTASAFGQQGGGHNGLGWNVVYGAEPLVEHRLKGYAP